MAEQRYQAVLAVIKDGRTVTETAAAVGVSRQSLHAWLAKYEAGGLEGLVDRSHRPLSSPHQMLAAGGGGGVGGPAEASVVGSAADRSRGQQGRSWPRGDRVLGVSLSAAGGAGGAGRAAAPQAGVEAVGAGPAE